MSLDPTPFEPAVGAFIDRYKVERRIGEGAFGVVTKVTHRDTQKTYALKHQKLWKVPREHRSTLVKRFRLEYETGLINSDFLVRSHDFGEVKGNPYLIMDFCQGGNLRHIIQANLSIDRKLRLCTDVLMGLRALHAEGKVHRDLKPENILLDNERAKLCDFGIAGHLNIQFTVVGQDGKPLEVMGSYNYMSPEQLHPTNRQETLLPTIDIFAFGVICYELLSGRLPFGPWDLERDMVPYLKRVAHGQWDDIHLWNNNVPQGWKQVIERCLMPQREQRFQKIDHILEFLNIQTPSQISRGQSNHDLIGLQVMQGENHGTQYLLRDYLRSSQKSMLRLGRINPDYSNDIALKEDYSSYISRAHATLEWHESNNWCIRDGQWIDRNRGWQPSKNGTWVNGTPADNQNGLYLQIGDIITIGNTTLKVVYLLNNKKMQNG